VAEFEPAGLQHLAAAKCEELPGEVGRHVRAGLQGRNRFDDIGRQIVVLTQQLDVHELCRQDVVEVVRDAAGELAHGSEFFGLAEAFLELIAFGDEAGLLEVLVGEFRELGPDEVECLADFGEVLPGHARDGAEGLAVNGFIGADRARVGYHRFIVDGVVAHLADQPVGDMEVGHADAGAAIPEPAAQAGLHHGAFAVEATDDGIGLFAVAAAGFGAADQLAEVAEVARARDRAPIRPGDDRGHAGGGGKRILDALEFIDVEEVGQGELRWRRDEVAGLFLGQEHALGFRVFAYGDVAADQGGARKGPARIVARREFGAPPAWFAGDLHHVVEGFGARTFAHSRHRAVE